MDDEYDLYIRPNLSYLCDNIIPSDMCILLADTLTTMDVEQIDRDENNYGKRRGASTFLDRIKRREHWFERLMKALCKAELEQVARKICPQHHIFQNRNQQQQPGSGAPVNPTAPHVTYNISDCRNVQVGDHANQVVQHQPPIGTGEPDFRSSSPSTESSVIIERRNDDSMDLTTIDPPSQSDTRGASLNMASGIGTETRGLGEANIAHTEPKSVRSDYPPPYTELPKPGERSVGAREKPSLAEYLPREQAMVQSKYSPRGDQTSLNPERSHTRSEFEGRSQTGMTEYSQRGRTSVSPEPATSYSGDRETRIKQGYPAPYTAEQATRSPQQVCGTETRRDIQAMPDSQDQPEMHPSEKMRAEIAAQARDAAASPAHYQASLTTCAVPDSQDHPEMHPLQKFRAEIEAHTSREPTNSARGDLSRVLTGTLTPNISEGNPVRNITPITMAPSVTTVPRQPTEDANDPRARSALPSNSAPHVIPAAQPLMSNFDLTLHDTFPSTRAAAIAAEREAAIAEQASCHLSRTSCFSSTDSSRTRRKVANAPAEVQEERETSSIELPSNLYDPDNIENTPHASDVLPDQMAHQTVPKLADIADSPDSVQHMPPGVPLLPDFGELASFSLQANGAGNPKSLGAGVTGHVANHVTPVAEPENGQCVVANENNGQGFYAPNRVLLLSVAVGGVAIVGGFLMYRHLAGK